MQETKHCDNRPPSLKEFLIHNFTGKFYKVLDTIDCSMLILNIEMQVIPGRFFKYDVFFSTPDDVFIAQQCHRRFCNVMRETSISF